jgi:hypothetical protein
MSIVINIYNLEDLTSLARQTSWLSRPLVNKVNIEVDGIKPEKAKYLEKTLQNLLNDCGCLWGELFLIITFLACFLPAFITDGFILKPFLIYLSISIVSAVIGKLFGLFLSYRKLHRLYNDISLSITQT